MQYYRTNFRSKILFQRFLGKVKKYHKVVITIKNLVTKKLDDSASVPPVHIGLKGITNECHFKTFALKEFGGSLQLSEDWTQKRARVNGLGKTERNN